MVMGCLSNTVTGGAGCMWAGIMTAVAPTDSRHRTDQRALEVGDLDLATPEKMRLEEKQRQARRTRKVRVQACHPKTRAGLPVGLGPAACKSEDIGLFLHAVTSHGISLKTICLSPCSYRLQQPRAPQLTGTARLPGR